MSACLQVIGVVEADMDRGHHPGLEERLEDPVSHRVRDEVKVERVFPAEGKAQQHSAPRMVPIPPTPARGQTSAEGADGERNPPLAL